MQDPSHNFVGLYLRNQGTYRQSEKTLLSSNMFSRCPHNMVNIGSLMAEICWRVWGTPANFIGFRVVAALSLLHGSQIVSVSQTLRRWTEGVTRVWQGDHHVGLWPTFLVEVMLLPSSKQWIVLNWPVVLFHGNLNFRETTSQEYCWKCQSFIYLFIFVLTYASSFFTIPVNAIIHRAVLEFSTLRICWKWDGMHAWEMDSAYVALLGCHCRVY